MIDGLKETEGWAARECGEGDMPRDILEARIGEPNQDKTRVPEREGKDKWAIRAEKDGDYYELFIWGPYDSTHSHPMQEMKMWRMGGDYELAGAIFHDYPLHWQEDVPDENPLMYKTVEVYNKYSYLPDDPLTIEKYLMPKPDNWENMDEIDKEDWFLSNKDEKYLEHVEKEEGSNLQTGIEIADYTEVWWDFD